MKRITKIFAILNLILFSSMYSALAVNISEDVNLYNKGECAYTLQANDGKGFYDLTCTYVEYIDSQGIGHPAYCIDREIDGIGEYDNYNVNLAELIQDDRLWRVAINGYPYKTVEELDVANEYDAFFATKQAIYSILGGWDINTHYKAVNERGERILVAIRKMVNEGRYGAEKYGEPSVNVDKNGELETEIIGEVKYLVQRYTVTSIYPLKSYQVVIQNKVDGTKIFDENGNETSNCTTSNFKIAIPYSSLESNINCTIGIVNANVKTYPVFYGKTYLANTQNYMVTTDPYEITQTKTNLSFNTDNATAQIIKKDEETGSVISNTTFAVYDVENNLIGTSITDENGVAIIYNLHPGTYIVKEITPNDEYQLNNETKTITLEYGETATVLFLNKKKTGNLKIIKVDKDNNKIYLGGVEFDLYSHELDKIVGTYFTDVNGEIYLENLRIGKYSLIEKNTGIWYELSEDTDVEIITDNTIELTIPNELKKGKVKIIKVDADHNEIKLEGIKFELVNENGDVIDTIVTDSNGEAISKELSIRDNENVMIREVETKKEYVLSKDIQTIKLVAGQVKDAIFKNEKKKGRIRVIKIDSDNNEKRLQNVEFDVLDEDGNIIEKLITDENGEAITKKLPIDQKYTIVETKTQEKYTLTEEIQIVTIEQDKITDVIFENEIKKGQIKVIKVDKNDNAIRLDGVVFEILDKNNTIVDVIITNENGEAISKELSIDEYKIREVITKVEYKLTEEIQTVTLNEKEIKTLIFENEKKPLTKKGIEE